MPKYILFFIVIAFFATHIQCQQWYETGNPHFLDTSTVFPALKEANTFKVVKFFSPWCKYCRFIKAFVDNYKSSHEISSNLKFYEFNCQSNGAAFCFEHFQVRAYPAVIIINQHGDSVQRIDGLYPQDVLDSILEDFNNRAKALLQKHHQSNPNEQKNQENKKQEQKKQEEHKQQDKTQKDKQQKREEIKQESKIEVKPQQGQIHNQGKHQVQEKNQKNQQAQIVKKMVDQLGAQETVKVHPSKPDQEEEMFKYQVKQQSSSTLKYILYLVGITIGIMYAIKIFTSHKEQGKHSKTSPATKQTKNSETKPSSKVSARDIQNQILVQEISDQHL